MSIEQGSHIADARKGLIDRLDKTLKGGESSEIKNTKYGYDSTVRPYGYTLQTLPDGAVVYNPAGILNKVDRVGDMLTRTVDDNLVAEPGKMARRDIRVLGRNIKDRFDYWRGKKDEKPSSAHSRLVDIVTSGPKRYRGEPSAIAHNADRLGVGEYYKLHEKGIQLTDPTLLTEGINLQDIFRSEAPELQKIDRFDALEKAGDYLGRLHREHGALGEVHSQNFIFRNLDESETIVNEPVLGFPNIVPNPDKYTDERLRTWNEPKAVDLLDFLMVASTEELRKSGSWANVEKAMESVLKGYNDSVMARDTEELAKRGRLTLVTDKQTAVLELPDTVTTKLRGLFSWHNQVRLDARKDNAKILRQLVIDTCDKFKPQAQAA